MPDLIDTKHISKLCSSLAIALLVAVLWISTFQLNSVLFADWMRSSFVSFLFLPAGVRLLSILLFEEAALLGLFVGNLYTCHLYHADMSLASSIGMSLISATNPYLALKLSRSLLKTDRLFSELTLTKLIYICVFYASLNSISHNLYFLQLGLINELQHNLLAMFIGDFVGCLLTLFVFSWTIKLIRYYRSVS